MKLATLRRRVAVIVALVALTTMLGVPPAQAAEPINAFYAVSESGDPVGLGATTVIGPPFGSFSAEAGQVLYVTANDLSSSSSVSWSMGFETVAPLGVGSFENIVAFASSGPKLPRNYMYIWNQNRKECVTASGSFDVLEFEKSDQIVTRLALDFSYYCEGVETSPGVHGSIRINSAVPIDYAALDAYAPGHGYVVLPTSACPELTDSIRRLYLAYFGREPELDGWTYWNRIYRGPNAGLAVMSQAFADSTEFIQTYGALSNEQFATLVYQNVLGRQPDAGGLAHWVNALNGGYERGSLMLAFSESSEYVMLTNTAPPLAGYLQWYDNRVQFACGKRYQEGMALVDPPPSMHVDVLLRNLSPQSRNYFWGFNVPGGWVQTDEFVMRPESYDIWWNVSLAEWNPTDIWTASDEFIDWAIVVYDHPHSATRLPYTGSIAALTADVSGGAMASQTAEEPVVTAFDNFAGLELEPLN